MLFSGLARTDNSSAIIDQNIRQGMRFKHTERDFLQTSTPVLLRASAGERLSTCKRDCFHSRPVLAQRGWLLFWAPRSAEAPPGTQPGWCSSCCSCLSWLGTRSAERKRWARYLTFTWSNFKIRLKESFRMKNRYACIWNLHILLCAYGESISARTNHTVGSYCQPDWVKRSRSGHGSFCWLINLY